MFLKVIKAIEKNKKDLVVSMFEGDRICIKPDPENRDVQIFILSKSDKDFGAVDVVSYLVHKDDKCSIYLMNNDGKTIDTLLNSL